MAGRWRASAGPRTAGPVTLTYGSAEFEEGMSIDDVMSLADLSLLGNKPAKRD